MRLKLVLKKQWYDLIDKGIKKEEYRDNTQYYRNIFWDECCCWKDYDEVTFYHGYATDRPSMTFKIKDIMPRNPGLEHQR